MLTIYSCSFPLDTSESDTGLRTNEAGYGPARQGTTPRGGGPRRAVILIIILDLVMNVTKLAVADTDHAIVERDHSVEKFVVDW